MNIASLFELSLRGSLLLLVVVLCDFALGGRISSGWRRAWWLFVALSYLLPVSSTFLPPIPWPQVTNAFAAKQDDAATTNGALHFLQTLISTHPAPDAPISIFNWIWLCGVILGALRILYTLNRVSRQWSTKRLSTDSTLLNLLEDAKARARITAPIGLVVSDEIAAPALLGWMRPRILIPTRMAACPPDELRAVFLHELAHFKHLDIPANWVFTAVGLVHWFNPLAWLAVAQWNRFREEAADEQAIRWLGQSSSETYGETLLKTLRNCSGLGTPFGALAIGESIHNLKRRILMIHHHSAKTNRRAVGTLVTILLALLIYVSPTLTVMADVTEDASKKAAVEAMQPWLAESDAGDYAKMWTDAAKSFQTAVTSEKWIAAGTSVRKPLGKLLSRQFASALLQVSDGSMHLPKGTYVIAQFDSSFANLKSAMETVTFEKESDGAWRAAGYYIKPN